MEAFTNAGFPLMLNAGTEFELFQPICPEDTLVASSRIADIYEREGKTGAMLFGILESTYVNQNDDIVAKVRITMIGRSTK